MRVDQPSRRPPHRTPRHRIPAIIQLKAGCHFGEAQQGFDYGRDKDVLCSANEQNVEDGNHNCQYRSGDCDLPTNRAIVCRAPRQPRRPPFVETGGDGFWHYGRAGRGDILC